MNMIEKIRRYAEKYDDYDRRDKLSYRERTANEHARYVLDDLIKELENEKPENDVDLIKVLEQDSKPVLVDENAKIDLAGEKEKADVGINRDGEVPAEAVHAGREGFTKEVPEIHAGLSATGSTEKSEG